MSGTTEEFETDEALDVQLARQLRINRWLIRGNHLASYFFVGAVVFAVLGAVFQRPAPLVAVDPAGRAIPLKRMK